MHDDVKCFDMDLAEALLERDGSLPEPVADHVLGSVEVTYFERDVVIEALDNYLETLASDDTEDRDLTLRFRDKVRRAHK